MFKSKFSQVIALLFVVIALFYVDNTKAVLAKQSNFQQLPDLVTANIEKNTKLDDISTSRIVTKTKNQKPLVDYFVYVKGIPMSLAHQEFLFEQSKNLGLDYQQALAIIMTESNFNSETISKTNDYGYFQINKKSHKKLAQSTGTENEPLDGLVNIEWGTTLLSDAQLYWVEKGYTGDELDRLVWSSLIKGVNGVGKAGESKYHTHRIKKNLVRVQKIINKEVTLDEL